MSESKQIGTMNGKWSFLMKLFLATWPFFLGWAVWVTSETFLNRSFRQAGDRFTLGMAISLESRIRTELALEMKSMNETIQSNTKKLTRIEAFWEQEHGLKPVVK